MREDVPLRRPPALEFTRRGVLDRHGNLDPLVQRDPRRVWV